MEFVREHKTLIVIIVCIVIAYLLWQSYTVKSAVYNLYDKWLGLSGFVKILIVLILLGAVYYLFKNNY